MRVIGIMGLKGSGKSEVADRLISEHGFERVKFARGLKVMLDAFLSYRGADDETIERMIEGDLKEVPTPLLNGKSPREAMVTLGTEWGREMISPDLWVDSTVDHIRDFYANDDGALIVLDDVRFENEVAAIRSLGGELWRIERPGLFAGAHASEQLDVEADRTIHNDGSLAELRFLVAVAVDPRRAARQDAHLRFARAA